MKKIIVAVFVLGLSFMTVLPFLYDDEVSVAQNKLGLEEEAEGNGQTQFTPLPILPSPYKNIASRKPLFASLRKSLKKAFTAKTFKETRYDDYETEEQYNSRLDNFYQSSDGGFSSSNFYEGGSPARKSPYMRAADGRRATAPAAEEYRGEDEEYIQREPSQSSPIKGIHNISTDERAQQIFDSSKIHEEIMNRVQNSSAKQGAELPPSVGRGDISQNSASYLTSGLGSSAEFPSGAAAAADSSDSFGEEGPSSSGGVGEGFMGSSSVSSGEKDIPEISPVFETAVGQTEQAARNHESYFKDLKEDMQEHVRRNARPRSRKKEENPPTPKMEEYDPQKWKDVPALMCSNITRENPSNSNDVMDDIKENCNNQADERKIKVKIDTDKKVIINAGTLEKGKYVIIAGERSDENSKEAICVSGLKAAGAKFQGIDEVENFKKEESSPLVKPLELKAWKTAGKEGSSPSDQSNLSEKGFKAIPIKEYLELKKDSFVISVDKNEPNAFYVDPEGFNTYSGLNKMVENINKEIEKQSRQEKPSEENEIRPSGKKPNAGKKSNPNKEVSAVKNRKSNPIEKAEPAKSGNITAVKK